MGRECPVSGKKTTFGNHITERGKAKYLGGVGKKTTGISRRTFKPNLQRIHVLAAERNDSICSGGHIGDSKRTVNSRGRWQASDVPAHQSLERQRQGPRKAQEPLPDLTI